MKFLENVLAGIVASVIFDAFLPGSGEAVRHFFNS